MTDEARAAELSGPVAVTGATGFIGRALCARLLAHGIAVRALVRRADIDLPDAVERIGGDLDDSLALDRLIADCSLVVHCAGSVRGATRSAFDRVNVAGTRQLLARIGQRAPGTRIIHLSSLAAREPQLSDYAASKHAAEALYLRGSPCRWTILRPTAVYGPGDRELLPLLRTMARGLAPVPAVADARVTLIHVADVIEAILAAAHMPATIDGCFEISDARSGGYRWDELAAAVAGLTHRRVRTLSVPVALLRGLGRLNGNLARLTGRAPMLTPGKVRELTHPDWSCRTEPFISMTGWQPKIDLEAGLDSVLH